MKNEFAIYEIILNGKSLGPVMYCPVCGKGSELSNKCPYCGTVNKTTEVKEK